MEPSFEHKRIAELEQEKELHRSLKESLFKIKPVTIQKKSFFKRLTPTLLHHMKDISFGSFIFFSVFLCFGVSIFLHGILFPSHYNSEFESPTGITLVENAPIQIESILPNVSKFSELTSTQQFFTIKNLVSFNKFKELEEVLNKLPKNFDKNLLTPLLYMNSPNDGQITSMDLQEIIHSYSQSSGAFSNPNYFMTQQILINHGADWKAYNYLFLKFTSNSDQWRMYWINYLYKNDKKILPLYEHILKDSLTPQQQYSIQLLEKIDAKKQ